MLGDVRSRTYRLTVEGELSDRMQSSFAGMKLARAAGNTTLTGDVRDPAELQGILQRLADLGLTLLEATTVEPGSRSPV
jgi:hypothetical protein